MNRRHFLQIAAAATSSSSLLAQSPVASGSFSFGSKALATVPLDFIGVSYESPQLANPAFFSPDNAPLIKLYKELSPTGGVLRTGGNISAFTAWRDDPSVPITPDEQAMFDKGKRYWEWDLTDPTIRKGKHEAIFTPASIKALAGFLDATGWKVLYGLNFGKGTPEQAAAEAACVQKFVGKNLIAFQLGNEIDSWSGSFRPKPWDFDAYFSQWQQWVKIIRAKVPNAPFAGPDVANRLDWMEQMADRLGKNITLLTKHHYAMGPAGDPRMNAEHLLGPDDAVAKEIASAQRAKAIAGVGFRNSECGSCYHGGQPGVSDGFASSLWGADYLLTLAQGGHVGVNLHGGGNGFYSPIVGDADAGFSARPLYYGMQFAQQFAGFTIFESKLDSIRTNVTGYAARRQGETLVALINKDSITAEIAISASIAAKSQPHEALLLSAPTLASLSGVTFQKTAVGPVSDPKGKHAIYRVAPYSALLLRFS